MRINVENQNIPQHWTVIYCLTTTATTTGKKHAHTHIHAQNEWETKFQSTTTKQKYCILSKLKPIWCLLCVILIFCFCFLLHCFSFYFSFALSLKYKKKTNKNKKKTHKIKYTKQNFYTWAIYLFFSIHSSTLYVRMRVRVFEFLWE